MEKFGPGDHLRRDLGALEDHVDLHLFVGSADGKRAGDPGSFLHGNPGKMVEKDGENWENVGRTANINGNKWRTTEPRNHLTLGFDSFEHDSRMKKHIWGPTKHSKVSWFMREGARVAESPEDGGIMPST